MFHSIAISSETGNWYCLTGRDLTQIREVVLLSTLFSGSTICRAFVRVASIVNVLF